MTRLLIYYGFNPEQPDKFGQVSLCLQYMLVKINSLQFIMSKLSTLFEVFHHVIGKKWSDHGLRHDKLCVSLPVCVYVCIRTVCDCVCL